MRAAWRTHAGLVRRSLERGFYQGWDLHPAQLASRYAATFGFFREGLPAAAARLRGYAERRAGNGAGREGSGEDEAERGGEGRAERVLEEPATARAERVLEEPATARALAGFLGRGLDCGAVTEPELTGLTGLDRAGLDALAGPGPAGR